MAKIIIIPHVLEHYVPQIYPIPYYMTSHVPFYTPFIPSQTPIDTSIGVLQNNCQYSFVDNRYDPLDGYFAWNCKPGKELEEKMNRSCRTLLIFDQEISEKFWDKKEIEDYVEKNIANDVVIQRGKSNWNFVFKTIEERHLFESWFEKQTLGNYIYLDIHTQERLNEITEWMDKSDPSIEHRRSRRPLVGNIINLSIVFRHERDKMYFLLRWLHVEEQKDEEK